ncbi:MAG: hypothetical protein SCK28_13610 [Bacillota bacterium]|nr:hypothetical protein [Bacillota bacterium]
MFNIKRMRKMYSFVLALMIIFSLNSVAFANEEITAGEIYVSVWPEYDEPGVLVIYSGEVKNNSSEAFDGYIRFNVPNEMDKAEMVCETEQGMLCVIYQVEEMGDYKQISWKVTKPIAPGGTLPFMLEYYYDPIQGETDKTIEFEFVPTYDMLSLVWDVKEPFNSTGFTIEPSLDSRGQDNNGFNTYRATNYNISKEEAQNLTIKYTRTSTEPSIDKSLVTGGTASTSNDKVADANKSLVLVLVAGFLGVIGFFAVYALKNNNKSKTKYSKKSNKQNKKVSKNNSSDSQELINEKKKIRKLLLDGKITEETYQQLAEELENEKR